MAKVSSELATTDRQVELGITYTGYATASVEGRIAVEYFDPKPEIQEQKYAYKCHRVSANGEDQVWPVNALDFHPMYVSFTLASSCFRSSSATITYRYNTFASAGSDGTVSVWDHKSKKRLRQFTKFHSAVPSVSFNCDGTKLAIGVSYNWDEGAEGAKHAERPSVFIREVGPELKVSHSPVNFYVMHIILTSACFV